MSEFTAKITWLAAADARGHLMRAHLMRRALAEQRIRVDIVTTSDAGRRFLRALGTPSTLLSSGYAVCFDEAQNLQRVRTQARIVGWALSPSGMSRDLMKLRELCRGSDLAVNDFHPLLLLSRVGVPVVHVHGTHLWRAVAHHFAAPPVDALFSAALVALRARGFAVVEHTLDAAALARGSDAPRHVFVPPILNAPRRTRDEIRAALGVRPEQRLVAVYLNPHFRDARAALAVERAVAGAGAALWAVGEGFASRPGWRAYDGDFVDVAAAADVLVSAPGMGALAISSVLGTPLAALLCDQPEQRDNLRFLASSATPHVVLPYRTEGLELELGAAIETLLRAPRRAVAPDAAVRAVHAEWVALFQSLLARARSRALVSPQRRWRIAHA